MGKALLYRLFRVGKIPDQLRAQLETEGVLLQDEGIPVSVTYRNFRRPGMYAGWRRVWSSGSFTLTRSRVVGLAASSPLVNAPLADPRLRRLTLSMEQPDTLLMALDASLFHDDWSGALEYRFRTPQAQAFLDALTARLA